jgi:hypothetical protein
MMSTDALIAEWITIRTTLKRQTDQLKSGDQVRVPGLDAAQCTADIAARIKICLGEIEGLLKSYSSRG